MALKFGLQEGPTLAAAMAWLSGLPPATPSRLIYSRARTMRLLIRRGRDGWRADKGLVERLAARAIRALPDDPDALADILHGLGLIRAWSSTTLAELLIACLRRRRIRFDKVLSRAFTFEAGQKQAVDREIIAASQWLSRAPLDWETFSTAAAYLQRSRIGSPSFRYGLCFVAYIVMSIQPRVVDALIRANPNRLRLAAIAEAAVMMAIGAEERANPKALLRCRNPALASFGAATLVCTPVFWLTEIPFLECHATLLAGGVDPTDAVWMLGWRVNKAFRELERQERQYRNNMVRLSVLARQPDAAFGGAEHAEAEESRLSADNLAIEGKFPESRDQLADALKALASVWPPGGLTEDQLEWLEKSFANSAELRLRLAEMLSHQANREWLLRRDIARLEEYVGLARDAADIPSTDFFFHEEAYQDLAGPAARAIHLLFENDKRGVGKRTSDLVYTLAKSARSMAEKPFAAQRMPAKWDALLTRGAVAGRVAFTVILCAPEAPRPNLTGLADLAFDFARCILSAGSVPVQHATVFQRLTSEAVQSLPYASDPHAMCELWVNDPLLPDFPRALAAWSRVEVIDAQQDLAVRLFQAVMSPSLSSRSEEVSLNQMVSLLDKAVETAAVSSRADLTELICRLWEDGYRSWAQIDARWIDSAELLTRAVAAPGPERDRLLAEPAFSATYCRFMIG